MIARPVAVLEFTIHGCHELAAHTPEERLIEGIIFNAVRF